MSKKKTTEKIEESAEPESQTPVKPQPVYVVMTDSGNAVSSKIKTTTEIYMEDANRGTDETV